MNFNPFKRNIEAESKDAVTIVPEHRKESKKGMFKSFVDGLGVWKKLIGSDSPEMAETNFQTSWVQTCIDCRAKNLANGTILMYKGKGKDRQEIVDHEFLTMLDSPNLWNQSFYELFYLIGASLDVYGDCYIKIVKTSAGKPAQFLLLNACKIKPVLNEEKTNVDHYEYQNGTQKVNYAIDDVIYIKLPSLENPFKGLATIESCKNVIDIDNFQQLFQKKFFYNDASVNVVLEYDGELSDEAYLRLQKAQESKKGAQNSNSYMILEDGLKYQNTKTTQKEMDFVKSRDSVRDEIIGKMGIPKSIIIGGSANFATANVEQFSFVKNTIKPFSRFVIDRLNIWIKKVYGNEYTIEMEYDDFSDPENEFRLYDMLLKNSVIEVSEAREAFGFSSKKPSELVGQNSDTTNLPANTP